MVNQSHPGGSGLSIGCHVAHGTRVACFAELPARNVSNPGHAGSRIAGRVARVRLAVEAEVARPAVAELGVGVDAAGLLLDAVLALLLVPPEVDAVLVRRAPRRSRSRRCPGPWPGAHAVVQVAGCSPRCHRSSRRPPRRAGRPGPSAASCRAASCPRCSSPRRCWRCRRRSGARSRPGPGTWGIPSDVSRCAHGVSRQ